MASRISRSTLLGSASDRTLLGRWGYPTALGAVAVTTLLFLPLRPYLDPGPWAWGYLLVVGAVAALAGVGPALVAGFAAFLADNYFFIRPYGSLGVRDSEAAVQLVAFLVVAVVWGWVAGRLREREVDAIRNEAEADFLLELSSRVSNEPTVESMAVFVTGELRRLLDASRVVLWTFTAGEQPVEFSATGASLPAETVEALRPVVTWVAEQRCAVGLEPDDDAVTPGLPSDAAYDIFIALTTAEGSEGVLQLGWARGERPMLGTRPRRLLTSFAEMIGTFLLNRRLADTRAHVEAAREADRLKTALLSSVSHELKTPLAAVTAAVTDLASREEGGIDEALVRERLALVTDDLRRLEQEIADLLDISRLEAGQWVPRPDGYEAGEIIADVVSREPVWARTHIAFDIPDPGPVVYTDFTQLSRAMRNVVDNALVYGPVDEPIVIGASTAGHRTLLWVQDRGPGVPDREKDRVFEKFYRGTAGQARAGSTGLGLSVAREIVLANDGTLWVEDAEGGGARFVFGLPSAPPRGLPTPESGERGADATETSEGL